MFVSFLINFTGSLILLILKWIKISMVLIRFVYVSLFYFVCFYGLMSTLDFVRPLACIKFTSSESCNILFDQVGLCISIQNVLQCYCLPDVLMQVDLICSCRNNCSLKMMVFLLGCFWKGGPCGRQFFHLFGLFLHWQSAYFQFTHTSARLLCCTHVLELYFSLSPFFCVKSLSLPLQLHFHSEPTLHFSRNFQYTF